jgi:hypothetical protein
LDEVLAQGASWNGAMMHDKSGTLLESVTFRPRRGLPFRRSFA